jgi:hypothetical protein
MKDRENVLRQLDEADNMIMIIDQAVKNGNPIDPAEAEIDFNNKTKVTVYYRSRTAS